MSDSTTATIAPGDNTLARPQFINEVSAAYSDRGKSVMLLTGNTHDLFYSKKADRFVDLGFALYHYLSEIFTVLRLDISTGLGGYLSDDLKALQDTINKADAAAIYDDEKVGDIQRKMAATRHSPLPALVHMHEILQAVKKVKVDLKKSAKPVCTIIRFAGSLFPSGDFDKLSEIDRQRLVTFLNLIESQWFKESGNLLLLIADTRSEVNSRILAQPSVQSIEIELPDKERRASYVNSFLAGKTSQVTFTPSLDAFVEDTAGLTLTALYDLLEKAHRTATAISRKDILAQINTVMKADLGDIIKITMPEHSPKDIVGYAQTGAIIRNIFARCEKKETAVPAILVSGANGAGKTYQLEAYAAESGRVVIELIGLRGMYFGQTDTFFEKLRLRLKTYGKILILIDEAHTQMGSVHKSDTHETEKRLAGNIIKMMGDPTLFGKVLWALGTSRPDELDPDVKSRDPIQIPIFDLDGEERQSYVSELFARAGVPI
ncbi:AAA family ATPase, partial [bacterium]|nr:AAA family ATPase [bacterium]